jgi:hypothetical protein
MPTYQGGCHCGAFRFAIHKDEPITRAIECNCSVCTKKGVQLVPVDDSEMEFLQGWDQLTVYQWGSKTAHHWFCPICGTHAVNRPRNHPDRYSINARCLDDYWSLRSSLAIEPFDGQNHPKDRQDA